MGSQLTPVNKQFAPAFASAHSLKANQQAILYEQKVNSDRKQMLVNMAPEQREMMNEINKMIDQTMAQVIERINYKRDLEKKNKDLKEKNLKREDEVNSLYLLNNRISQEMMQQQTKKNKMIDECEFIKQQVRQFENIKNQVLKEKKREIGDA